MLAHTRDQVLREKKCIFPLVIAMTIQSIKLSIVLL